MPKNITYPPASEISLELAAEHPLLQMMINDDFGGFKARINQRTELLGAKVKTEFDIDFNRISVGRALGSTLLHFAAAMPNEQFLRYLIEDKKIDVNTINAEGETALYFASCYNKVKATEALLDAGADPNKENFNEITPLMSAANVGSTGVIKELLKAREGGIKCEVDKVGFEEKTALFFASMEGYGEAVGTLLNAGAAPNKVDCDGDTPLMHAVLRGSMTVIDELLKTREGRTKCEVDKVDGNGSTALHLASYFGVEGSVDALLNAGADPNKVDRSGDTALILAVKEGHTEVIDKLLETQEGRVKCDIDKIDSGGRTALDWASNGGKVETYYALRLHGAKKSLLFGETPPAIISIDNLVIEHLWDENNRLKEALKKEAKQLDDAASKLAEMKMQLIKQRFLVNTESSPSPLRSKRKRDSVSSSARSAKRANQIDAVMSESASEEPDFPTL